MLRLFWGLDVDLHVAKISNRQVLAVAVWTADFLDEIARATASVRSIA
jgi:hypothetical protein